MRSSPSLDRVFPETYIPHASCFVSWDAAHFRRKTEIPILTPKEFLEQDLNM